MGFIHPNGYVEVVLLWFSLCETVYTQFIVKDADINLLIKTFPLSYFFLL